MEATSLVTKLALDNEISTRVQRDSWLASYLGKPWIVPDDSMPSWLSVSIPVEDKDLENGDSVTLAVAKLQAFKNRTVQVQNALGGVVLSNPAYIRFSGFGLSVLGNDGVLISIAGDVVYKTGTFTSLGATDPSQRSLEFKLTGNVGAGLVTKYFSGGRFAYGMSVSYKMFGSIRAKFFAIDRIILHGCQGRLSSPGGGLLEMLSGTVVRVDGNLFAAALDHSPNTFNKPTNIPRPAEWSANSNAGACLRYWIRGAIYNRGLLVFYGNTFYAVLKDNLEAVASPPEDPASYYPLTFPSWTPKTEYKSGQRVTDIDPKGRMRTLRAHIDHRSSTRAVIATSDARYWWDVTENQLWSSLAGSHIFRRGDIVRPDKNSTALYICLAATARKNGVGGNPLLPKLGGDAGTPFTVTTLNRLSIPNNNLNVGDEIEFTDINYTGTGNDTNTIRTGVYYYVKTVAGNFLTISDTPGGNVVPITGLVTTYSSGLVKAKYHPWALLSGLTPWTSQIPAVEPGLFYCWGMGKIIAARRQGFVSSLSPSLDDGAWWFVNDNYKLNPTNQKTNAANVLEWPSVGSAITVTSA